MTRPGLKATRAPRLSVAARHLDLAAGEVRLLAHHLGIPTVSTAGALHRPGGAQ